MTRSKRQTAPRAAVAIAAGWLGACAGNGVGLDANGQPLGSAGGASGPLIADFDSIQAQVFTPICAVCHAGADAPQGLRLDAADSYNLLVGVPSNEVPSVLRIKPGDPDNSYVIQKVEGHAAVGARMPFGGPYLSTDVIAVIRQWITDGALRSASPPPAGFTIDSTAPARDEVLAPPPPQVMIGFSRTLDVTRLTAQSVRLENLSTSGETAPTVVPSVWSVPAADARALLVWPLRALGAGHYRVLLNTNAVADLQGTPLGAGAATDARDVEITVSEFDVGAVP